MCIGTGCHAGAVQDAEVGRQNREISSFNGNCSDDQKEKCKEAAKARRSKETEYFKELENLLPVPKQAQESEEFHFDKISLIRFSIAYLKTREFINTGNMTSSLEKEILPEVDILSCLDGFNLVLSSGGDVIYASDNITRYLGISAVDILGHPFSHYVHPCDHHQLQLLTCHKGNNQADNDLENPLLQILARVKCLVTERGRMVNLKQASNKSVKISGKTQQMKGSKQGKVFIGMARVVGHDGVDRQQIGVFNTKHGMDMRFSEADTGLSTIAGYFPHHLVGTSFYALVHPLDSKMVQEAFKNLPEYGVCETAPYRLLCSGGGQVWVQTVARVVCRRGKQGQAVVCRHTQCSGVFDRGEVLSLKQLETLRKFNGAKKDYRLAQKKNHWNIAGGRINNKTWNKLAAPSVEITEYAMRKKFQNPIRSTIPVIIDHRQNSDKEINYDNMKLSTEGQPKFVTSSLFENSESLRASQSLDIDFVPQTNYPILLEKHGEIMSNACNKVEDIMDDANFLKNLELLEESIQMEDLEQLSPHSGYESVTFDKNEELQFLDFVDPAEFEKNCQVASWTNLLPATKKSNLAREDQDKHKSLENRKAEDCLKTSCDKAEDENNIDIERKTYSDDQIRYNMLQNPWTNSADRTSLKIMCGTSNNQKISESMQGIKTKNNQQIVTLWSDSVRKREHCITNNVGENFKKMRFDSNIQGIRIYMDNGSHGFAEL